MGMLQNRDGEDVAEEEEEEVGVGHTDHHRSVRWIFHVFMTRYQLLAIALPLPMYPLQLSCNKSTILAETF